MSHPAGDEQLPCGEILAEPKIAFVVNTAMLYDYFVREGFDYIRENELFEHAFPSDMYYRRDEPMMTASCSSSMLGLITFGTCSCAVEALKALACGNVLDSEAWQFPSVGREIPNVVLPYGMTPRRSENLPWPEYAALIRRVDVGLSLRARLIRATHRLTWPHAGQWRLRIASGRNRARTILREHHQCPSFDRSAC